MSDLLEIGFEIKRARKRAGLSQAQLALRSGLSRARIEALENSRIPDIGFKNLLRIMHALGLDLRMTALNQQRPTLDELIEEDAASQ